MGIPRTVKEAVQQNPGYVDRLCDEPEKVNSIITGFERYPDLLSNKDLDRDTIRTILHLMQDTLIAQNEQVLIENFDRLNRLGGFDYTFVLLTSTQGAWALLFVDVDAGRCNLYSSHDQADFNNQIVQLLDSGSVKERFGRNPFVEKFELAAGVSRCDSGVYVIMKAIQLLRMIREKQNDPLVQMPEYYRAEIAHLLQCLAGSATGTQLPIRATLPVKEPVESLMQRSASPSTSSSTSSGLRYNPLRDNGKKFFACLYSLL